MYYRDCTAHYATEVIQEILNNAEGREALEMIQQFMDNQINTDEIGNRL